MVTTATGEKIAHRAVLIIALDENDELAAYVMESQNDKWVKAVRGQKIIISNKKHNCDSMMKHLLKEIVLFLNFKYILICFHQSISKIYHNVYFKKICLFK
jgi:hypothetical protein